jgi:hypothetical protein
MTPRVNRVDIAVKQARYRTFYILINANGNIESASLDSRRQGPLYVEARGYLHPAVDFFTRAVRSADALGTTDGHLLALVCRSAN